MWLWTGQVGETSQEVINKFKNVIAVGNLDYKSDLASSSSRGPAMDGRIKPDICAQGTNVYSTYPNYTYQSIIWNINGLVQEFLEF